MIYSQRRPADYLSDGSPVNIYVILSGVGNVGDKIPTLKEKSGDRPKGQLEYLVDLYKKILAGERIRTADRLITNQLLYQLSYTSMLDTEIEF